MHRIIYLNGRPRYSVRENLITYNLPAIAKDYRPNIHLTRLSQSLSYSSTGRLSANQALGPLKWFFARATIVDRLQIARDVQKHLDGLVYQGCAMHKIRKHFVTLAYLASRGTSTTIAPYLSQFFSTHVKEIIANDYRRLNDWEHAIQKLKGLGPTSGPLSQLARGRNRHPHYHTQRVRRSSSPSGSDSGNNSYSLSKFYRGRSLTGPAPRYRSQTMPPMYYPAPRVAAPNFLAIPASRGIMSGFPSPSVFAQDPWREAEMDDIRDHQAYLEQQVAQLQLNQQDLEDEVVQQVGGYGQLQIGWGT